jgi:uncharacterized membrane protein SpoIIM required for sporulation
MHMVLVLVVISVVFSAGFVAGAFAMALQSIREQEVRDRLQRRYGASAFPPPPTSSFQLRGPLFDQDGGA